ncbi:MAG TPA: hypothetical protein VJR89_42015, partial [Polyangiales bacterium]|nr:hypothetical protein [Polyangiales bacterium]
NIFGYTLLPGTEFFARREEYRIETIPVAGYGKAKGEYVVGCHTFSVDEGIEGYFLITGHIALVRGYVMPLTARYLALSKTAPVSALFRAALRAVAEEFQRDLPELDLSDRMQVYEHRDVLYLAALAAPARLYAVLHRTIADWLAKHAVDTQRIAEALCVLELDAAFCPRGGAALRIEQRFGFDAERVAYHLNRMELPPPGAFEARPSSLSIRHPGGVGVVLKDPDGGSWFRGQVETSPAPVVASAAP